MPEQLDAQISTLIADVDATGSVDNAAFRDALDQARTAMEDAFDRGADGATLVYARARVVDAVLKRL
ncbi:MAG: hypothetical protein AAF460_03870, partial [Pseudomonadota bacterium]